MANKQRKLRGRQQPRIKIAPKGDESWGDLAIELAATYGIKLLTWQKLVLRVWLSRGPEGAFSALSHCLSCPRQNGKTEIIIALILFCLIVLGYRVLYTAHRSDLAMEVFTRLATIFEVYPDLDEISDVHRSNGKESIEVTIQNDDGAITKSKVQFRTRVGNSGRGISKVNVLIYDEAQALTQKLAKDLNALTLATGEENSMTIYVGTPPDPEEVGDVFRILRKGILEDPDNAVSSWLEWSVDEPKNKRDKKWWYYTNPSLGILIPECNLASEVERTNDEDFNRENLGFWDINAEGEDHPIDTINWRLCKTDNPPKSLGIVCFGVKFSFDGKMCALSVCNKVEGQPAHIECLEFSSVMNGMQWLLDYLVPSFNKTAQIILDGNVNCDNLTDKLLYLGAPKSLIMRSKMVDMQYACSTFTNAVREHSITHYGQEGLTKSAINCLRRPIGRMGGWGFSSFMDGYAEIIESCALAYFATTKTNRDPERMGKFW